MRPLDSVRQRANIPTAHRSLSPAVHPTSRERSVTGILCAPHERFVVCTASAYPAIWAVRSLRAGSAYVPIWAGADGAYPRPSWALQGAGECRTSLCPRFPPPGTSRRQGEDGGGLRSASRGREGDAQETTIKDPTNTTMPASTDARLAVAAIAGGSTRGRARLGRRRPEGSR
jgi:hypothetical protein